HITNGARASLVIPHRDQKLILLEAPIQKEAFTPLGSPVRIRPAPSFFFSLVLLTRGKALGREGYEQRQAR
ncbi:MAG: hypothetical protein ACXVI1_11210, partial [Halobacteriota archaeon]